MDASDEIDHAKAEQAFNELQSLLTPYRHQQMKKQMLDAIDEDPFRSFVMDKFGRKVLAADLIFADATDGIKNLMLDVAREAAKGNDVCDLSKAMFDEIATNYVAKNAPPKPSAKGVLE